MQYVKGLSIHHCHFIVALSTTLCFIGSITKESVAQTDTIARKRNKIENFRIQFGLAVIPRKVVFMPLRESVSTPSGTNRSGGLMGFSTDPIGFDGYLQMDYNVIPKSKKIALFTGISYSFQHLSYTGNRDSLISYGFDSEVVKKIKQSHLLGFSLAINGEKILRAFSEVGINISLIRFNQNIVERENSSERDPVTISPELSGFAVYTAIGYGFNLGPIKLTPHLRYAFKPFSRLHAVGLGFNVTLHSIIQRK